MVPEALASISNASIRGFYRLSLCAIDAYPVGVQYGAEGFKKMHINPIGKSKIDQSCEVVGLYCDSRTPHQPRIG